MEKQGQDIEESSVASPFEKVRQATRLYGMLAYAKLQAIQLPKPSLDERTYSDLVDECLARIPKYLPEWSCPESVDYSYSVTGNISQVDKPKLDYILATLKAISTDNVTVVIDGSEALDSKAMVDAMAQAWDSHSSETYRSLMQTIEQIDIERARANLANQELMIETPESLAMSNIGDSTGTVDVEAIALDPYNSNQESYMDVEEFDDSERLAAGYKENTEKLLFHIDQSLEELGEVVDSL